MISFMVTARIKEVCIRKVHGARVGAITLMLSKEFLILVMISNLLVAVPVWYFGNLWLSEFAYHTSVRLMIFPLTTILMLLLAFTTVSYQTVSASFVNPAKLLRSE